MKHKTRTERLDMETVGSIKQLSADYGLLLSGYYDHSGLNAPGDGRMSYMAFLAAMGGGEVTPQQEARVARSLMQARQSLRKAGRAPIMKELLTDLAKIAKAYQDDPDILPRADLRGMLRVVAKAKARAKLK